MASTSTRKGPSMSTQTAAVTSKDGTTITYDRHGDGPPLVVVDGALSSRAMGSGQLIAPVLADRFSVYVYDRRGRGDSGDTAPFATDREVEDLLAVIEAAGGSADVFGHSSGAALALEAARQGAAIRHLALYEVPMVVDASRSPVGNDFRSRLQALVDQGQRSQAIKLFMTEGVGAPKAMAMIMPITPAWKKITPIAHTLPYDIAHVEEFLHGRPLPGGRWDDLDLPILVIAGGKSPAWMRHAMDELSRALPHAQLKVLDGQTHMLKPEVTGPVLADFFAAT